METLDEIKNGVDHPAYYGGKDNPYEAVKVLHAWGLDTDAYLWTVGKYLSRAGKKDGNSLLKDLSKARWYLDYKIRLLEEQQKVTESVVDTLKKVPSEVADKLTTMSNGSHDYHTSHEWTGLTCHPINQSDTLAKAKLPCNIETAVVPDCADEVKF